MTTYSKTSKVKYEDYYLFFDVVKRKIINFLELKLNNVWDFAMFYDAYDIVCCFENYYPEDYQERIKLIEDYYLNILMKTIKNIKKTEDLTDEERGRLISEKYNSESSFSFARLKDMVDRDMAKVYSFMDHFSKIEEEIKKKENIGNSGQEVIGYVSGGLE